MPTPMGIGYLVTFILPLVYQSIPNPIGLWWYWQHGPRPMPAELERRAFTVSSIIPVVQLFTVGGTIALLVSKGLVTLALWPDFTQSASTIIIGGVAGCGWLTIYVAVLVRFPPSKELLARHEFIQRSALFWIPVSTAAAILEEMWRAVCLSSLFVVSRVYAIALTSIAFGLAHSQSFGRAVGATACAVYLAVLFFWSGSVVTPIVAHAVINVGTILIVRILHTKCYRSTARP